MTRTEPIDVAIAQDAGRIVQERRRAILRGLREQWGLLAALERAGDGQPPPDLPCDGAAISDLSRGQERHIDAVFKSPPSGALFISPPGVTADTRSPGGSPSLPAADLPAKNPNAEVKPAFPLGRWT